MGIVTRTGSVVHAEASSQKPVCEPTGASRIGGFSEYRFTNKPVTCKKCLKKTAK